MKINKKALDLYAQRIKEKSHLKKEREKVTKMYYMMYTYGICPNCGNSKNVGIPLFNFSGDVKCPICKFTICLNSDYYIIWKDGKRLRE